MSLEKYLETTAKRLRRIAGELYEVKGSIQSRHPVEGFFSTAKEQIEFIQESHLPDESPEVLSLRFNLIDDLCELGFELIERSEDVVTLPAGWTPAHLRHEVLSVCLEVLWDMEKRIDLRSAVWLTERQFYISFISFLRRNWQRNWDTAQELSREHNFDTVPYEEKWWLDPTRALPTIWGSCKCAKRCAATGLLHRRLRG
jgi:hypothetical protein